MGCGPDDIINGWKVSKMTHYINRLKLAHARAEAIIVKLQQKQIKQNQEVQSEKLSLAVVMEDNTLSPYFEDYMEYFNRTGLLRFYEFAEDFKEKLFLDKLITSLNDEIEAAVTETWDYMSVAVNIRSAFEEFFTFNSPLCITKEIPTPIFKVLELYCKKLDDLETYSESAIPIAASTNAVKAIMLCRSEVLKTLQNVDFVQFLRHPIGGKMIQRIGGVSFTGLGKLLKGNKSPERSDPSSSLELDRNEKFASGGSDEESLGGGPRKKSISMAISGIFKKKLSKQGDELEALHDDEDESSNAMDSFKKILTRNNSDSETMKNRSLVERPKFLDSFRKKSKASIRNTNSPDFFHETIASSTNISSNQDLKPINLSITVPEIRETATPTTAEPEIDAETFMSLELEDENHNNDLDLNLPGQNESSSALLILPKQYYDLDIQITKLKFDLSLIEKQKKEFIDDPIMSKNLQYAQRGITNEINELNDQKIVIENSEIDNVITKGHAITIIGESKILVAQDGKNYAVYPIEVKRWNQEGAQSGWSVFRRYSHFLNLHKTLRELFPTLMVGIDLPGKMLSGLMKKKAIFLENRRSALEKYLFVNCI